MKLDKRNENANIGIKIFISDNIYILKVYEMYTKIHGVKSALSKPTG